MQDYLNLRWAYMCKGGISDIVAVCIVWVNIFVWGGQVVRGCRVS